MTTQHHGVSLFGKPHETRRLVWAAIGIVLSVLCAVAMIGNVTWAEETNWFLFVFAGFGVVGFGIMALDQWQEWPEGETPAWTHWFSAIFWATFGAYALFGLIYQLFITDADTNWWLVAISPVLAVLMFWVAYQEIQKARAR